MRLTKKITPAKPVQEVKEQQPIAKVGKGKTKILWSAEIPCGKYLHRTAKYVHDNDEGYWNWMVREDLLEKWGIEVPVEAKEKKRVYDKIRVGNWTWMRLYTVPGNGIPSQWLND